MTDAASAAASFATAITLDLAIPLEAMDDATLIAEGEYDFDLPEAPGVILDIGANVGLFAIWAAHRWPAAFINAFEPWPENLRDLRANTAPYGQIHITDSAVSDRNHYARMAPGHNRMCCHLATASPEGASIEVHVMDAANCIAADFIKIDCEGEEWKILQRLDLSRAQAIAIEAHSYYLAWRIQRFLRARGFTCILCKETLNGCHLLKFRPTKNEEPGTKNELLLPPKLFIGLPVYGGYHPHFVGSLMNMMADPPCDSMSIVQCSGDSLVSRARNKLAAQFIHDSQATHFLFLDTDLIFSSDHIRRLLSHEVPVVAGLYPKKQRELAWVVNCLDDCPPPHERGLQPVKYAGTGCLMIERGIFEQLIEAHPELAYTPDDGDSHKHTRWDFFSVGVWTDPKTDRRRHLSEDWYFCQRVLDLGHQVLADTQVLLKHCGDCVYPLDDLPRKESSHPSADSL